MAGLSCLCTPNIGSFGCPCTRMIKSHVSQREISLYQDGCARTARDSSMELPTRTTRNSAMEWTTLRMAILPVRTTILALRTTTPPYSNPFIRQLCTTTSSYSGNVNFIPTYSYDGNGLYNYAGSSGSCGYGILTSCLNQSSFSRTCVCYVSMSLYDFFRGRKCFMYRKCFT